MEMYSRQYFIERYRESDTEELLDRFVTSDLTDEAKDAMFAVFKERGISDKELETLIHKARKEQFRTTTPTNECDFCRKSAGLAPIKDQGQKFCSEACLRNARQLEAAVDIPDEEIVKRAIEIKKGPCPSCRGRFSKIEARKSYWIWAAIFFTRWGTNTKICCKKCGTKNNLISIVSCLCLGWWSLPRGLFLTPVKVISNIAEIYRRIDNIEPSAEMLHVVKLQFAEALLKKQPEKIKNIV